PCDERTPPPVPRVADAAPPRDAGGGVPDRGPGPGAAGPRRRLGRPGRGGRGDAAADVRQPGGLRRQVPRLRADALLRPPGARRVRRRLARPPRRLGAGPGPAAAVPLPSAVAAAGRPAAVRALAAADRRRPLDLPAAGQLGAGGSAKRVALMLRQ